VQPTCGEECDDGNSIPGDGCEPDCTSPVVCGDGVLDPPEECDDGNSLPDDGCFNCKLEDLSCFQGENAAISANARRVAFESTADYLGLNPDRNREIYVFNRKLFLKALNKGSDQETALRMSLQQVTDTSENDFSSIAIVNEMPTMSGAGRFLAFVSNASFCEGSIPGGLFDPVTQCQADADCPGGTCGNTDHNREVFHFDLKRRVLNQVSRTVDTATETIKNLHPNLRAMRGNLLVFDSPGDLASGTCAGGLFVGAPCASDINCPGGSCGNPDGSRELFLWILRSGELQQITTAPDGESIVGRSVNFSTRATAFSSTGSLLEPNPLGIRQIYRIVKTLDSITQVTRIDSSSDRCQGGPNHLQPCGAPSDCPFGACVHATVSEEPAQSKKRVVAFMSDADLTGENPDLNREIFLWDEKTGFAQLTHTQACENNQPIVSSKGTFVAFESTCDLIPSHGNPDQSIFFFDIARGGVLAQLVIRGPGASSRPLTSRRWGVLVFEADPGRMTCRGGPNDGALCTESSSCAPDGECVDEPNRLCLFDAREAQLIGPVVKVR